MAQNPFDQLRVNATNVRQSINWYTRQIQGLRDLQRGVNSALAQSSELKSSITPGELYIFRYDPKFKNELPYYDTMPLVLPFATAPGGFLGLNLHYLPYGWRFKLMGALLDLVANEKDGVRRAQVSWKILNQSSKFPGVSPCVKHYLTAHVKTKFLNIPADQWLAASMMPIEQFQGATKTAVFADSRRMI